MEPPLVPHTKQPNTNNGGHQMIVEHAAIYVGNARPVVSDVTRRHYGSPLVCVDLMQSANAYVNVSLHGTFGELREWVGEIAERLSEAECSHYGNVVGYVNNADVVTGAES